MPIEQAIADLEEFKGVVLAWDEAWRDKDLQAKLRTIINQQKVAIRQQVIESGCYVTLTISPPAMIGGMIMRNVDPFATMFDPPYGMPMIPQIIDMIDQTIGVIRAGAKEPIKKISEPQIDNKITKNYAFVAMPIDPQNPELEDILDAIKEGADRCGVQAERVDEEQSNDRITDRILESIQKAEFVIVDLTNSRPNVFYEAGYAQGIGKTPIYIAKDGTKLEFDLKDYPIIFFKNMKQLKDSLEARLRGLAEKKAQI